MKKIMMKLVLGMAFCLLCMLGNEKEVKADLIYWPEDDFVKEHEEACEKQMNHHSGRLYEVISSGKMYLEPDGAPVPTFADSTKVGDLYSIYFLYTNPANGEVWGCTGSRSWLRMDGMQLQYDHTEFTKDHWNQIGAYTGEAVGYELTFPMKLYDYPCSGDSIEIVESGDVGNGVSAEAWLTPSSFYKDEKGKLWGYVDTYNWGYHKGWYCVSDQSVSVVQDYDKSKKIDLGDAQAVLRAALKIEDMEDTGNRVFTLGDAQTVLKAALKISDDKTIVLNSGIGKQLPKPESMTRPPVDVPIATSPAVTTPPEDTEPDEIPEVTGPTVDINPPVIPDIITGPAVAPVTGEAVSGSATELAEVYIAVFDQLGCYNDDYIALNKNIQFLNDMDKYLVEQYLENKHGVDVIWTASVDDLLKAGLGLDYTYYRLYGVYYSASGPMYSEDGLQIRVDAGITRGGLEGQGYNFVLEKQDGKWTVVSRENTWIS